jgi:hypothetical protein
MEIVVLKHGLESDLPKTLASFFYFHLFVWRVLSFEPMNESILFSASLATFNSSAYLNILEEYATDGTLLQTII